MALLVKDHKTWRLDSDTPVPSRPVVSGNRGINTHLSELISEILEPMVLEMGGGEVASTEEALHAIDEVNKKIIPGDTDWNKLNIMDEIGQMPHHKTHMMVNGHVGMDGMNKAPCEGGGIALTPTNNGPVVMDGMNKVDCEGGGNALTPNNAPGSMNDECNILNDSDNETIDVLSLLFSQGGVLRGETIGENKYVEKSGSPRAKRMAKGDIRHYFERKNISPLKDGQKF